MSGITSEMTNLLNTYSTSKFEFSLSDSFADNKVRNYLHAKATAPSYFILRFGPLDRSGNFCFPLA